MSLVIYRINIKKPCNKKKIMEIQNLFLPSKKTYKIKETSNMYKIQTHRKKKFVNESFKTIKINNELSFLIGELRYEYKHLDTHKMEEKCIIDFIKSKSKHLYNGIINDKNEKKNYLYDYIDNTKKTICKNEYNDNTKKTLYKYGNIKIDKIVVFREPILRRYELLLNIMSLGNFNKVKTKNGFDNFYHTGLIAEVNSKNFFIDKYYFVNVSTSYINNNHPLETINVDMKGETITINQLLDTTLNKQNIEDFYSYDVFKNNCQMFTRELLQNIGLYTKEIDIFLFQNIENMVKEIPELVNISKIVVDMSILCKQLFNQSR